MSGEEEVRGCGGARVLGCGGEGVWEQNGNASDMLGGEEVSPD